MKRKTETPRRQNHRSGLTSVERSLMGCLAPAPDWQQLRGHLRRSLTDGDGGPPQESSGFRLDTWAHEFRNLAEALTRPAFRTRRNGLSSCLRTILSSVTLSLSDLELLTATLYQVKGGAAVMKKRKSASRSVGAGR